MCGEMVEMGEMAAIPTPVFIVRTALLVVGVLPATGGVTPRSSRLLIRSASAASLSCLRLMARVAAFTVSMTTIVR